MSPQVTQVLQQLQAQSEDLVYVIAKTLKNPSPVYTEWFVNELEYVLASIAVLEELAYVNLEPRQQTILAKAQEILVNVKHNKQD